MQHRAIRLMASKLAVAGVIEGNLTDEGLAAMSDCQDLTTALARELTNGIKHEVEDLGAVFKKMAILKPVSDVIETTAVAVTEAPAIPDNTAVIDIVGVSAEQSSVSEEVSLFVTEGELIVLNTVRTRKRGKKAAVYEGQMSLFDLFDLASA